MAGTDTLTWPDALDAFGADWSAPILAAGMDAATLAGVLAARTPFGIAAEGDDWVLLAPGAPDEVPGEWADLGGGYGTVVLRRGWGPRGGLTGALADGVSLLAPGGRLFAADLDAARLLDASPVAYPYQYRFTLDPAAAERLEASTVPAADLALGVGRAGLRHVAGLVVDEVRGAYDGPAEYWEAVEAGAWPSLADLPADDRGLLLERLAAALSDLAPIGGLVERRPWFAATGVRG
ncbi:MAG: hypothetical protein KQH83_00780 [Actinobacteria bacterium]|nr:hypothetical protein [Actinomycetota bacterium]